MDVIVQEAARILLLNPHNELLKFAMSTAYARHPLPCAEWCWMTPGGGREPGETWDETARRKLWEETELDSSTLGPWVWRIEHHLLDECACRLHCERFVIVRVESDAISNTNQLDHEREAYTHYRWWAIEEMERSADIFFPIGLAGFLALVITGAIPDHPINLLSDLTDW